VTEAEVEVRRIRGLAWLSGVRVGGLLEMHDASVAAKELERGERDAVAAAGREEERMQSESRAGDEIGRILAREGEIRAEVADLLHRAATFMSGR